MEKITLHLIHGRNKYNTELNLTSPLSALIAQVEEFTGIPQSGQKLICQGQTLTTHDPQKTLLQDLRLCHGSKIMILGRKVDPEQDESYQRILAIEKRTLEITQKFVEVSNQVRDIENGHLPREHFGQALKDLEKKSKSCSESWMKALESLDGITLEESQTIAKSKRKSVVNSINANMDRADEVLGRIDSLRAKAS